ncbi:MAG: hypothetical protein K2W85_00670 [Phycisphaerales bacterium]|nr:hypothetical protein [Phycisphaerales bacterium]
MTFRALGMLSALAVSAGLTAQASATVLTFDFGGTNSTQILDSYGDRVGDPNVFQPPAFSYGSAGGITPNVQVDYKPVLRLGAGNSPADPTRVFGNLTNVLYRDRNAPGFSPGILEINLFADAGFLVSLHYFDMAAVYNSVTGFGEDLPAKAIIVTDGAGVELFRQDYDINNPPSTLLPGTLPLRSRRFDWDANPLRAQQIRIRIDLTQLITVGGSKVDRVGIDNIKFSQIPTPGASAMLLIGGAILGGRRRR